MRRHEVVSSGIILGVVGGIAMLTAAMTSAVREELAPIHPLMVIGESFIGPDAFQGAARISFGALIHVATSVTLGVVIAAVIPRDHTVTCGMALGAGLALFAMGFMMSTIVPLVNPGFRAGFQPIGGSWVIAHILFGMTVGIAPALRRSLARERRALPSKRDVIQPGAAPAPGTKTT